MPNHLNYFSPSSPHGHAVVARTLHLIAWILLILPIFVMVSTFFWDPFTHLGLPHETRNNSLDICMIADGFGIIAGIIAGILNRPFALLAMLLHICSLLLLPSFSCA
jgi:hypothetical protein